jgi:hypothetical protein
MEESPVVLLLQLRDGEVQTVLRSSQDPSIGTTIASFAARNCVRSVATAYIDMWGITQILGNYGRSGGCLMNNYLSYWENGKMERLCMCISME